MLKRLLILVSLLLLASTSFAAGPVIFHDLVNDTTPQLGGNLDLNTYEITMKDVDVIEVSAGINGTVAPEALSLLTSTNSIYIRNFDGAANEDLLFVWEVPFDFTGSTVQVATKNWVSNATGPATGEVVAYSITGVSVGASELLSSAQGSAVTSSFTVAASPTYVQYDSLTTAYVTVTPTGIAAGETVFFAVTRLATTTDTYAQDVGLAKLLIKYSQAKTND